MAEASASPTSSAHCPFCDTKLTNKDHLKRHLKEVHEISVKLLTKYSDGTTSEQSCSSSVKGFLKDTDLGNKMKTLKSVLNENFSSYLQHMKQWIRCEVSRGEFDENIRPLFTFETIVAHNEFLISFIKEIRSISKSAVWKTQFQTLQDLDSIESASVSQKAKIKPKEDISDASSVKSDEGGDSDGEIMEMTTAIPDFESLYALSYVCATENGCRNVEKKAVPVLHNAIEELMKKIYTAIMMKRKNFKVRADGFVYDVGKVDPKEINPGDQPIYSGNITLPELLDVLETHPDLIPVKSVYNFTIQEIVNHLKENDEDQNENAEDSEME